MHEIRAATTPLTGLLLLLGWCCCAAAAAAARTYAAAAAFLVSSCPVRIFDADAQAVHCQLSTRNGIDIVTRRGAGL